ncbi:MAG TPA: Gfo/Idh/MocA family oxidoreductase [Caulobacteraceae bacterium]|nr:Gfo/Idh/MocA family oxidoreductase [Caulobacteraceae bacterium]
MSQPIPVLLVGLGNIGFRHLQGMAAIASRVALTAVDPSGEARQRAADEWTKAGGADARFLSDLSGIDAAEVAIVATSAAGRLELMRQVVDGARPSRLVLEKVVFQDVDHFEQARDLARAAGVKVWVNCPRRLWPAYGALAEALKGEAFTLRVRGRNIGLACNGVHFIDLLQFLAGYPDVSVESAAIDDVVPAKREGYFECFGALALVTPSGARLEIEVRPDSPEKTEVEILRPGGELIAVDDAAGVVANLGGEARRDFGRSPYQSELTGDVVLDLFERNDCDLATLEDSEAAHRAFLGALKPAFDARGVDTSGGLPIT